MKEIREVNPLPGDPDKPRFFIGETSIADNITFDIRAKFSSDSAVKLAAKTMTVGHDSTKMDRIIPAMLGNEHLRDLFRAPIRDTAAIVSLAMKYRLLCDYTAFLVLDTDTIHSTKDPPDNQTDASVIEQAGMPTALTLTAYPNPFSGRTSIVVGVRKASMVSVSVYDILGRLVRVLALDEMIRGARVYTWDGTDGEGRIMPNGLYFISMTAKDIESGAMKAIRRTVVFVR